MFLDVPLPRCVCCTVFLDLVFVLVLSILYWQSFGCFSSAGCLLVNTQHTWDFEQWTVIITV